MSAKEKQAAPKETFVFPAPLTSKRPMKSDKRAQRALQARQRGFASLHDITKYCKQESSHER